MNSPPKKGNSMNPISLGADHAGFALKEKIKKWLTKKKIPFIDLGDKKLRPKDDYPDYAAKVARTVAKNEGLGILICGSAQGICIAANKIKGIRAVAPYNPLEAVLSRKHENANIICLSGWFFTLMKAKKMIGLFLNTPFSGAKRHIRRLNKIKKLEGKR